MRFLILTLFLLVGCASTHKLTSKMVEERERLIVMKVVHLNTQGDWSNSTALEYQLDGKKKSIHSAPQIVKREENGLSFVIVPESTKVFEIKDIIFGYRGLAYKMNSTPEKPWTKVTLPVGNDPVYIGTIYLESGKKIWKDKVFDTISDLQEVTKIELKNDSDQVATLLVERGIKGNLKTSLMPFPFKD